MKTRTKLFTAVILILLSGFITPSFGQNTASATITVNIITPITIAKTADMNFGNVAMYNPGPGSVVMTPAGVHTATGGVNIPSNMGIVTPASFTVTGQGFYSYTITLPSGPHILSDGFNTITATSFTSSPSGTGLLTAGRQTLQVGATILVSASQAPGTYVSSAPFEVIVNNN